MMELKEPCEIDRMSEQTSDIITGLRMLTDFLHQQLQICQLQLCEVMNGLSMIKDTLKAFDDYKNKLQE